MIPAKMIIREFNRSGCCSGLDRQLTIGKVQIEVPGIPCTDCRAGSYLGLKAHQRVRFAFKGKSLAVSGYGLHEVISVKLRDITIIISIVVYYYLI